MIEILTKVHDDTLAIRMSGEITSHDYDLIIPLLEEKIKTHGTINLYCEMEELEEVEPKAVWKDLKFDIKHFNDFRKVAIVGDKQWLEWGAKFAKPFTSAEVKYFDETEKARAMEWLMVGETEEHGR